MAKLLESKSVVDSQLEKLKKRVAALSQLGIVPNMRVILVGENPASLVYVKNKKTLSEKVGAQCTIDKLPENISKADFVSHLNSVVNNSTVHGCFVQLPLPQQLKDTPIAHMIPPSMDVDGFTPDSLFALMEGDKGEKALLPCTPKGIITLLQHYNIDISGKNIVIIGRSLIVGKPMSYLFTNHDATVTLCHSKTKNIKEHTQMADIIVVAIGVAEYLDETFLSKNKNQVIIDVGMNKKPDGKLCGDVHFQKVKDHCDSITPVPGGVGPMTVLSLIENLIFAAERKGR